MVLEHKHRHLPTHLMVWKHKHRHLPYEWGATIPCDKHPSDPTTYSPTYTQVMQIVDLTGTEDDITEDDIIDLTNPSNDVPNLRGVDDDIGVMCLIEVEYATGVLWNIPKHDVWSTDPIYDILVPLIAYGGQIQALYKGKVLHSFDISQPVSTLLLPEEDRIEIVCVLDKPGRTHLGDIVVLYERYGREYYNLIQDVDLINQEPFIDVSSVDKTFENSPENLCVLKIRGRVPDTFKIESY